MKKTALLSGLIAAGVLMAFTIASDPLPIGSALPKADVKMKDISGKEISLKESMTAKGLLVMFSCNTCPYVIRNQERTREICNYAKEKGYGVAVLNSNEAYRNGDDSFDAMKEYAKQQQYKWYYTVDKNHELADAFGATRTPECFLFNKEAKLVYHGAIDDNPSNASAVTRQHLRSAIDELEAGKEIAVKESRSVGCSIKRLK